MNARKYLEDEIEKLKLELSTTIPQEIQDALVSGDLRENSEYSSALARQHFVNIRLEQLLTRLDAHKSVDYSLLPKDAINIGSTVKLRCLSSNKMFYVKLIIGNDIDDMAECEEVTISSPMGMALKNKKVKDEVIVKLPSGTKKYRILQIKTIHDK